ncbi:hypothetical protein Btru_039508 [Bulinus truncatus]|nr:hypothetical protein Btru_039508 [Bulinus truncatus]
MFRCVLVFLSGATNGSRLRKRYVFEASYYSIVGQTAILTDMNLYLARRPALAIVLTIICHAELPPRAMNLSTEESLLHNETLDVLTFYRSIRATRTPTCNATAKWPVRTSQLLNILSKNHVFGEIPKYSFDHSIAPNQPSTCPTHVNTHADKPDFNLRAMCPWVYYLIDLGPGSFPRIIRQARCLCAACLKYPFLSCKNIRNIITVLEVKACDKGFAVINLRQYSVVVGCYCVHPKRIEPGKVEPDDNSGPTPTD